ncbi:alpha-1,2-fucosyltransferase [bacterium]|nr:alpha-1,2-fucosyltransferase [bacterium]
MITAYTIGSNGRLGNQMFQYAALLGMARARNFDFYTPGGRLFTEFSIKSSKPFTAEPPPKSQVREHKFGFIPEFLTVLPDNVDVMGFFQTEKYWEHCKQEVYDNFELRATNVSDEIADTLNKTFTGLHIRRTDYLGLSHYHTNLQPNYYKDALSQLKSTNALEDVLVFSDDVNWVKSEFIPEIKKSFSNRFCTSDDLLNYTNDTDELFMMTKCKSMIIANSSYSWWGAYLGCDRKNGIVIGPDKWFGPAGPQDYQDVMPQRWLRC